MTIGSSANVAAVVEVVRSLAAVSDPTFFVRILRDEGWSALEPIDLTVLER